MCLFGYGSGFGPYSIKNDSPNKRIVFTVLFVCFSMGLPDVYFGFRAVFQPNDIFAVGVEQQNGRDEREDDERHRLVHFGRSDREDRKAAAGHDRGE